jgi:transcriptional regulator of nitric oxide reductase
MSTAETRHEPDARMPVGAASLWLLLLCLLIAPVVHAAPELMRFIGTTESGTHYPGADRIEPPASKFPVARAMRGDEPLGYLFLTTDFVSTIGYSGKPIHVVVGLDADAVIRSVRLVEHSEPIVLIGIPEARIRKVIEGYIGFDVAEFARNIEQEKHQIDIVTGATVTIMVIDDTILRAAVKVARELRLGGLEPVAKQASGPRAVLDAGVEFVAKDWVALLGEGSLERLLLTVQDVNRAFASSGNVEAAARPESGAPNAVFIDMVAGLASVEGIGRNAIGDREYANLGRKLAPGQHALVIAGLGSYSFKGSGYVRGGIFDRIQLSQGDNVFRFHDYHHKRLRRITAAGAPDFDDVDIFMVPEEVPFDPAAPWRLELLVGRNIGPTTKAFQTFELRYQLPERFVRFEAPPPTAVLEHEMPLWQKIWLAKQVDITILVAALGLLTLIFFFQEWLTKRPLLTERVRTGFLLFTLIWLGLYANAQLSVVYVMTLFNALITGFAWDYLLLEALSVILWGGVAAALLLPIRGHAGAFEQGRQGVAYPTVDGAVGSARAALASEVHRVPGVVRLLAALAGSGRTSCRSRAVQDRGHPQVRPRVALRAVCGGNTRRRPVRRARLLPLPLPTRRRAGDPRAPAHVRVAQAIQRLRHALPDLCQRLHGPVDSSRGTDQSQRVPLLPALPGALSRRSAVPGDGQETRTARAQGGALGTHGRGCRQATVETGH